MLGVVGNACCTAALPLAPRSFGAQALLLAFGGLVEPGALVDAFVMRSLAWAGAAGAAAKARAFGAFSWSAAAPLFGALSSQLGIPALFWAYCAMNLCVCLPVVLLLPIEAAYREVSASDSATFSTAAPGAGPAPAPQESFVRRARHALGGSEPSSRLLRFCAPVIALVGFQMGIGQ